MTPVSMDFTLLNFRLQSSALTVVPFKDSPLLHQMWGSSLYISLNIFFRLGIGGLLTFS